MNLKQLMNNIILTVVNIVVTILIALLSVFNWSPTADVEARFFTNDMVRFTNTFRVSSGTRELMVYETLDDEVTGVHGVSYNIRYCRGNDCFRIINAEHVTFTAKDAWNGRIYEFPGRTTGNTHFRVERRSGFTRNSNLRLIVN